MAALLKLVRDVRHMSDLPAALGADPWAAATQTQRRAAELRAAVVGPLAALVDGGASVNNVVSLFLARHAAGTLDPNTAHVLRVLADADGGVPSFSTLKRYISAWRASGNKALGLLPKHTGRVRQAYGWEALAVAEYNLPSKPGFADVAWRLRSQGHPSATESRVKRYLKALPATLGEHSPARVGPHLHRLKRQKYQRRHLDDVLVGEIYAGDGHTCDCYVAHPNTGKPFRPELTCFIDIRSRFIPGWYFTESESAHSTLFALSTAMLRYDHVPAWLYIDRGAGYRAKLLSAENTGWYSKFDIETIGALPGNPHGKGWIERFFRSCRDKHDKFFAGGQVYCGDDAAEETNRRLSADLASGKRRLPSLAEYVASFAAFIEQYSNEPMDVLNGRTPAQEWARLVPVAVELTAEATLRPSETPTVQRQTVRLHNRFYYHEALALYDAQKVRVEYDLHDDKRVWVHDLKGRLVCEARLVNTIGVLPTSRLEEQRDKRLAGQVKRLEKHLAEAHARRADPITAEDQARAIAELERAALPAPGAKPEPTPPTSGEVIDVDVLDWRNDA
jgi:putative transposase